MKKSISFALILSALTIGKLEAFPTALYWTTANTDIVPTGRAFLDFSNYFTIFESVDRCRLNPENFFPLDIGLSLGLLSWHDWKVEVGIDLVEPTNHPWFFNGKIGIVEDKLFKNAPSFSFSAYGFGTEPGVTNFNIIDAVIGKTLPDKFPFLGGRVFFGGYFGSSTIGPDQGGFMVGYANGFRKRKDCHKVEYFKWFLVADYASGKNVVGGGGIGISYFFTPDISILTGPTWFNDAEINGKWKWTVQIGFLFTVFKPKIGTKAEKKPDTTEQFISQNCNKRNHEGVFSAF